MIIFTREKSRNKLFLGNIFPSLFDFRAKIQNGSILNLNLVASIIPNSKHIHLWENFNVKWKTIEDVEQSNLEVKTLMNIHHSLPSYASLHVQLSRRLVNILFFPRLCSSQVETAPPLSDRLCKSRLETRYERSKFNLSLHQRVLSPTWRVEKMAWITIER